MSDDDGTPQWFIACAHGGIEGGCRECYDHPEIVRPPLQPFVVRERPEPAIVHEYTCGAIQAGAMVVRCSTCGCIRQHDRPHDFVADIQLRGWICYCGIFNGEEKERQNECRTCQARRPM
jgi:hypothetical protein